MDILSSLGGMLGALFALALVLAMAMLPLLMLAFTIWPLVVFSAEPYIAVSHREPGSESMKRDLQTSGIVPTEP